MGKSEFIDELCKRLRLLPPDEAQKTVMFYSEAIDDRIEDGMTEEEAVMSLGSIDDIVREIMGSGYAHQSDARDEAPGGQSADPDKLVDRHYRLKAADTCEVRINDTSCDVTLEPSGDDMIHVHCTEGRGVRYEIAGGAVTTIRRVIEKEFSIFGLSLKLPIGAPSGKLVVQIPENAAGRLALSVNTSSGDVFLKLRSLAKLTVHTTSGDVRASRVDCSGDYSLSTVSGDIEAESVTCQKGTITTVSGDIDVGGFNCLAIWMSTTSGDMDASRVGCSEVKISTTSGDVELSGSVRERFAFNSVSGDVDFDLLCAPKNISLDSVSGDIEGSITGDPADYTFNVKSSSGRLRFPKDTSGPNTVRGKTVSGNITLRFN